MFESNIRRLKDTCYRFNFTNQIVIFENIISSRKDYQKSSKKFKVLFEWPKCISFIQI